MTAVAAALVQAAWNGDIERVQELLDQGVPVDARDRRHRSAFDVAIWQDSARLVKMLVGAGADLDQEIGEYQETVAMRLAARRNQVKVLEILLESGADANTIHRGLTAAGEAAQSGHVEALRVLLDHGAHLDDAGRRAGPLTQAAFWGHAHVVRYLLELGAMPAVRALQEARHRADYFKDDVERRGGFVQTILLLENAAAGT